MPEREKWEYKKRPVEGHFTLYGSQIEEYLDRAGAEGWELVSMRADGDAYTPLMFKRKVESGLCVPQKENDKKLTTLKAFLERVNGYGYLELSHDKVRDEYGYFHRKAGELLRELFPPKEDQQE